MVRDAEIIEAEFASLARHFGERVFSVAPIRVTMKCARAVASIQPGAESPLLGGLDLAHVFPQFRQDVFESPSSAKSSSSVRRADFPLIVRTFLFIRFKKAPTRSFLP